MIWKNFYMALIGLTTAFQLAFTVVGQQDTEATTTITALPVVELTTAEPSTPKEPAIYYKLVVRGTPGTTATVTNGQGQILLQETLDTTGETLWALTPGDYTAQVENGMAILFTLSENAAVYTEIPTYSDGEILYLSPIPS